MTTAVPVPPIFRESDNTYWMDGERWPGVTEILSDAGMIPPDHSLEEGTPGCTPIHDAIIAAANGTLDEPVVDPVLIPYVSAFRNFLLVNNARIFGIEHVVSDRRRRYCGTCDLLVVFSKRGPAPIVIDVRTGPPEPWHPVQLAAHADASGFADQGNLYLRYDGSFRLFETPKPEVKTHFDSFCAALSVWKWRESHGLHQ